MIFYKKEWGWEWAVVCVSAMKELHHFIGRGRGQPHYFNRVAALY